MAKSWIETGAMSGEVKWLGRQGVAGAWGNALMGDGADLTVPFEHCHLSVEMFGLLFFCIAA